MAFSVNSPQRLARIAGALYVVIILCGMGSEVGVRVPEHRARRSGRDRGQSDQANADLFRLSFAADTVMALSDVALAVLLFILLRPAGAVLALLAMAFRLVQAALIGASLLFQMAAVLMVTRLTGLGAEDSDALAAFFLAIHAHGYDLGLVFFGVACILLGLLIWRSGFLPRWLGVLVLAAGPVYLAGSFTRFLAPEALATVQIAYVVPLVAETAFALWLLIRGVDGEAWRKSAAT
jgi:hypothetical protein